MNKTGIHGEQSKGGEGANNEFRKIGEGNNH